MSRGAILGDAIGYLVGRRWGRRVLDTTLGRFVKAKHLDRAERALSRRGGWAVFLGRFTAALRVMIPGLAGMARMSYPRFAIANVSGGAVWGTTMVLAGYLAGSSLHVVEHYISAIGVGITLVLVTVLVVGRRVRRRDSRLEGDAAPPDSAGRSAPRLTVRS